MNKSYGPKAASMRTTSSKSHYIEENTWEAGLKRLLDRHGIAGDVVMRRLLTLREEAESAHKASTAVQPARQGAYRTRGRRLVSDARRILTELGDPTSPAFGVDKRVPNLRQSLMTFHQLVEDEVAARVSLARVLAPAKAGPAQHAGLICVIDGLAFDWHANFGKRPTANWHDYKSSRVSKFVEFCCDYLVEAQLLDWLPSKSRDLSKRSSREAFASLVNRRLQQLKRQKAIRPLITKFRLAFIGNDFTSWENAFETFRRWTHSQGKKVEVEFDEFQREFTWPSLLHSPLPTSVKRKRRSRPPAAGRR